MILTAIVHLLLLTLLNIGLGLAHRRVLGSPIGSRGRRNLATSCVLSLTTLHLGVLNIWRLNEVLLILGRRFRNALAAELV